MNKTVVSVGDASLTAADLSHLVPPNWLNDQLISFWLEHLRLNVLKDHPDVAFILPNTAYFIALTNDEEDLAPITKAHRLPHKQLVIVPVNDATQTNFDSTKGPAGSHWSMLVFHRPENTIFYLDSLPSSPVLSSSSRRPPYTRELLVHRLSVMSNAHSAKLVPLKAPSQHNSYDCGAFVCFYAEKCVARFLNKQPIATMFQKNKHVSQEQIDSFRQEIGIVACRLFDETHDNALKK